LEPIEVITPDLDAGPFHARQKALGATFYEDLGFLWTKRFREPEDEYWSIRRGCALWDVSSLVKWRFEGPDAMKALDLLTTRRVLDMQPGQVRYCAVLDERGMMLDEGTIFMLRPDRLFYFGNDEREEFEEDLRSHTEHLSVRIENVTREIPNVQVQGPKSYEVMSRLVSTDLSELRWFNFLPDEVTLAGVPGLVSRTGFTGELGYEFFLMDEGRGAEKLWDALMEEGAEPVGLDGIQPARIECGMVISEEDYWPGETDPFDLSFDAFVDLDGHHFVGRGAAAASSEIKARRFVTLSLEGDSAAEEGETVVAQGRTIGEVTSTSVTPRYGSLALAIVESGIAEEGTEVSVGGLAGLVKGFPIDDPMKLRPRSDPRNPVTAS
jgi:aminomethyltransferase